MNEIDALDMLREAIWTVIVVSGPPVGAAMVVGIIIALFQALTQIQEMTLTFVPKMIAIFAVAVISAPLAGMQILAFTQAIYARIETGF